MSMPILPRVASGAPGAVEECVERYKGLVWGLAQRLAGPEAEDAVQEIFIDLWKSAPRFQADLASEPTFVAMIARRRLIDRRRQSERRPVVLSLEQDVDAPGGGGLEASAEAALAARAIAELEAAERRCLWMSVGHGMSHAEISEQTRLPLGTVKTYVRRGLARVREKLLKPARRTGEMSYGPG